jgi:TetR/AcrR family tetracycline transcriptional repressor
VGTAKIDRAAVAETALRLLNEVGLDGLSLRAIAKELDVKAPALYWHFKDKQALLDEMATLIHRRLAADFDLSACTGWQDGLVAYNQNLRTTLLRYRDGAKVYSGTRFTGTDHAVTLEQQLRLMTGAGFTLRQAVLAGTTSYAYTIGFVTEEQGVRPMPDERREGYDIEERARGLAKYPLTAAAGREIFSDYDRRFDEGLRLIVAGVAAVHGA